MFDEVNDSICGHDIRFRDLDGIHLHCVVCLKETVKTITDAKNHKMRGLNEPVLNMELMLLAC